MQGAIRGGQNLEFVDTGPSRRLWAECPWDDIGGTVRGAKFFDDFENTPTLSTSAVTGKYASFADAGCTITQLADKSFGEIQLLLDGNTDEDDCIIQSGGNTGGMARFLDPTIATPHDVWFEARFKVSNITAGSGTVFCGLMSEGAAAANGVVTTADILANEDLIGFAILNAAPSVLQFTYKRIGQTAVVPIATVHTMVADTYVNVGFHYRYAANPVARKICVLKNNVLNPVGVTKANIEAVGFPDSNALALTLGSTTSVSVVAKNITMDWWKVATVEN
jgi:hypothetical protein